jgi:hypothetical protein
MSNKILRKELELTLVKTIEDVLTIVNSGATQKTIKATQEAAKTVAKKFYKTIKSEAKIKKTPAKTVAKKTVAVPQKTVKPIVKKVVQK